MNHHSTNLLEKCNHTNIDDEKIIHTLNQRYEIFIRTLDQLSISLKRILNTSLHQNHHYIDSDSNKQRRIFVSSSNSISKRKHKKISKKFVKQQQMPKLDIRVSCPEHLTKQQPNVHIN